MSLKQLDSAMREDLALTVRVVEDDDAALFGLCLLGIYHGSAHDEVGVRIFAKLAGDQAEGVLVLQKLVSMKHCGKTEQQNQLGPPGSQQAPPPRVGRAAENLRHVRDSCLEMPSPTPHHHLVPSKTRYALKLMCCG